mmetsp:Transcript_3732/g.5347  ORF Transcript_3732/g.5347 Transcript_3732/m.5347 type:complete len:90 (+) Transcript_3732:29-298(+)
MAKKAKKRKVKEHKIRRINENDARFKEGGQQVKKDKVKKQQVREVVKAPSSLFFQYNTNLRPPFHILLDTNFINMSIQMKLDIFKAFSL